MLKTDVKKINSGECEKYFKHFKSHINSYYNNREYYFKSISMDFDDLKQELLIVIMNTIREYNNWTKMKTQKFLLQRMKRNIYYKMREILKDKSDQMIVGNIYKNEENMEDNIVDSQIIFSKSNIPTTKSDFKDFFKKFTKDAKLIRMAMLKIFNGMSYAEIAPEFNLTKQGVHFKLHDFFRSIKRTLKKTNTSIDFLSL